MVMKAVDLFMLLRLKEKTTESDQEYDHRLVRKWSIFIKNDIGSISLAVK